MDLSPGDFARAYSPDGSCMMPVLIIGAHVKDGVRHYTVTDGRDEWDTYILGRMPESKPSERRGNREKGPKRK